MSKTIDGVPRELLERLQAQTELGNDWDEVQALLAAPVVERQEPVMKLEAERLWEGDGEYSVSFVKSVWLDECRKTGGTFMLYAEQPAPVAVVMSFEFEHPLSKERRTVTLTKQDVYDGMEDYFYDKLGEQICQCESVGETNVVDCNCDEYVHDFDQVTDRICLDKVKELNQ